MKKISVMLCAFLLGSVGTACFGGAIGVPAKVKVVHPRAVQRTVVAPTNECAPVAVVAVPCTPVKVVQPRVVQRMVVPPTCCTCESAVNVDPTRLAHVTTVHPRAVQRTVAAPACCECGTTIGVAYPGPAKVKIVYPRTVTRGVVVPVCE